MKEATLSEYKSLAKKVGKHDKTVKIGIMSNFTLTSLSDVLKVKCDQIKVTCETYEAGYNQIGQEIENPQSGLKTFTPDMTFIIISPKHIFNDNPQLMNSEEFVQDKKKREAFLKEKLEFMKQTIEGFKKNITGILVISNIKQLTYSSLGINEERLPLGIKEIVTRFNTELANTYSEDPKVYTYDFSGFFMKHGELNLVDEKLRYLGDFYIAPDYIPYLGEELMSYVKPFCSKNRKCIVLDLDNTLWGGIIGEDGFNGIALDDKPPGNAFYEFQKYLLSLHKRGMILAVNSKNNPDDALEVIRKHPFMLLREENFACMKINWIDKATNMKQIAKEINIGLDSLIFFDDDNLNRALVKEECPDVLVVDMPSDPSLYTRALKELTDMNTLQLTKEDFKKGQMYYQQRKRQEVMTESGDIEDFLKKLNMEIEINKATDFTIPRISQLTKKTNQFNLTTRRYTEEDIKKFVQSNDHIVRSIHVKDKFGDNGLTGLYIVKKEQDSASAVKDGAKKGGADNEGKECEVWKIDTLLLSCRIIGRNVESVMLAHICELAKAAGAQKIVGEYIPTKKNMQVKDLYEKNGFKKVDDSTFILKEFNLKIPDYMSVKKE